MQRHRTQSKNEALYIENEFHWIDVLFLPYNKCFGRSEKNAHTHISESTVATAALAVAAAATGIHFSFEVNIDSCRVFYFIAYLRYWHLKSLFHLIVISWPLSPFTSVPFLRYIYTLHCITIGAATAGGVGVGGAIATAAGYFSHRIFIALKWLIFGQSSRNLIQSTNTTYPFNGIRSSVRLFYFRFAFVDVVTVAGFYFAICGIVCGNRSLVRMLKICWCVFFFCCCCCK